MSSSPRLINHQVTAYSALPCDERLRDFLFDTVQVEDRAGTDIQLDTGAASGMNAAANSTISA